MKLHLAGAANMNLFTGYGAGYVSVNNQRIGKSVIVLPERIIEDWDASTFEALTSGQIEALTGLGQEIVLLGTGNRLRFPAREIMRPLTQAGMGFEVMDIQAACRTYNILVSEERKVAAALLFD